MCLFHQAVVLLVFFALARGTIVSNDITISGSPFVNYRTPSSIASDPNSRRNAVVFLLPAFGEALDGLPCSLPCSVVDKPFVVTQIQKIDDALMDNFETDIIIFHEGYPYPDEIAEIRNSTKRKIDFVNIDQVFLRIPMKLDPYLEQPTWSKRAKWRYHQMIRFMVSDIFQFPVMDNVDYFMRIDIDSCFKNTFPNLFSIMNGPGLPAVYLANDKSLEAAELLPGTELLQPLVTGYVKANKIAPGGPKRYIEAFEKRSVFTYSNNFEIVSVPFFRRQEVRDFIGFIEESLGIFRYRWGDSAMRYLSLALFATDDEIIHKKYFNISYHHPC